MSRKNIDDGGWFNTSKATKWDEDSRWNGNNHISCATNSQWDHETLYLTKKGVWILSGYSQWQGSTPWCRRIDANEATQWLITNNHDAPEQLTNYVSSLEA